MITDIIEYRQNHPTLTLQAIGTHFNVTRSYIHKVLKRNNIPTKGVRRKKSRSCRACGQLHYRHNRYCSPECHFQHKYLEVNCAFCHVSFYRSRWHIDYNYKRGYNNIYCGRTCYGRGQRDAK